MRCLTGSLARRFSSSPAADLCPATRSASVRSENTERSVCGGWENDDDDDDDGNDDALSAAPPPP